MRKNLKEIKRFTKTLLARIVCLSTKKDSSYGDIGYFSKNNPQTFDYTYANWGARRWECYYLVEQLNKIGIRDKVVADVGIGAPSESNFYTFYLKSGCKLFGFDPDDRLPEVTHLSDKCNIYRKSGEDMSVLADGSTDVVVVLSAFEHFPIQSFKNTLIEINRIMKKGGHLLITLDLTFDKKRSAPWAILEKTLNNLPEQENHTELKDSDQQVTLPYFMKMLEPYFYAENPSMYNKDLMPNRLLLDKKWNSYIAYMHLRKK